MLHALTTTGTPIPPDLHSALQRVRAEFVEMPDLQVTVAQAARLWGLEPTVCHTVLTTLVDAHFLVRTSRALFSKA